MENKLDQVCKEVLQSITPAKKDQEEVVAIAKTLVEKVAASAKKRGIDAKVRVEGSVAKDTWLKEEPDLDIFMCLPPTITRERLAKVSLEIAKEATAGAKQVERFAEHPYLEAFVDGFRVNIVPCYCTERGEWISATDRTPFHTDYILQHLPASLRNEVRLLKKFMQGIEIYGAEMKIGGFSGYLCELLVLHFRSFVETVRAFSECSARMTICIGNHCEDREKKLVLAFQEPLVVIDPVDKNRNVASAVQAQKIDTLVGAAREFLRAPSKQYFFPPKTKLLSGSALRKELVNREPAVVFVVFKAVEAVPDVLWGQYYRSQRALRKLLETNDFHVIRDAVWTDEKALAAFVIELEKTVISNVKCHAGPPLEREMECEDFLKKYIDSPEVVCGPYIENGRWIVQLHRKCVDAAELLGSKLKDGGKSAGLANRVSETLSKGFDIAVNTDIAKLCKSNEHLSEFLTKFLDGKPFWLKSPKA